MTLGDVTRVGVDVAVNSSYLVQYAVTTDTGPRPAIMFYRRDITQISSRIADDYSSAGGGCALWHGTVSIGLIL